MLPLWIEAQPMPVIALVVFGLAYLFTAFVFYDHPLSALGGAFVKPTSLREMLN
ncbi:MAG: hypothetical protein WBW74_04885 [Xanthobacteraceae bacterium]